MSRREETGSRLVDSEEPHPVSDLVSPGQASWLQRGLMG